VIAVRKYLKTNKGGELNMKIIASIFLGILLYSMSVIYLFSIWGIGGIIISVLTPLSIPIWLIMLFFNNFLAFIIWFLVTIIWLLVLVMNAA
jgi:hypothetical protein